LEGRGCANNQAQKAAAFNATMALALAEMPATGTYDFSWITAHVRDSDKQASGGSSGDGGDGEQRVLLVDVGGGQGQILKSILVKNPASHRTAASWKTSPLKP
jgi:hypothetical protein